VRTHRPSRHRTTGTRPSRAAAPAARVGPDQLVEQAVPFSVKLEGLVNVPV
jgi:hypothetical protein